MSITAIDGPGRLPVQSLYFTEQTLSPAEKRLLNLEKEGQPVKDIATAMQLSAREVQRLILTIKSKLKEDDADGQTCGNRKN